MKSLAIVIFIFSLIGCTSAQEERQEKAALHSQMGSALYERGIYHQALAEYLRAEKLDESNSELHNNLGLTYFMLKQFELAEKHLRMAIGLTPNNSDAKVNLARVLVSQKKFGQAQELLNQVFADLIYPMPQKVHFTQGLLHFENKRYGLARESFYKSLQMDRGNCYTATYYGRSLFELKSFQEATDALDRATGICVKIQRDEAQYYAAISRYRMGQKKLAIEKFEELLKLYPEGQFREKSRAMADLIKKEYK